MAPLPAVWISQVKPFSHVRVDNTGPFMMTAVLIQEVQLLIFYICIFICMATKATHLELASDLTSHIFLSALRHLASRIGRFFIIRYKLHGAKSETCWNKLLIRKVAPNMLTLTQHPCGLVVGGRRQGSQNPHFYNSEESDPDIQRIVNPSCWHRISAKFQTNVLS